MGSSGNLLWAGIAQSVWLLATGWTFRGSKSGGEARFSAPVQTGPWAHLTSYTMDTGSFPWVKRLGRAVDHPHPSGTEVKERVELYLYSTSGPSWPVLGELHSGNSLLTFRGNRSAPSSKVKKSRIVVIPDRRPIGVVIFLTLEDGTATL
jgi:hypothetical protein